MQTLDDVKDENEVKRKFTQRKRIRIVMIVVSCLLVGYAGFLSVSSIVDVVKDRNNKDIGDTITLLNKNEDESLQVYNTYVLSRANILDVATYGRYLLTSKSKVSQNLDLYTNKVRLMNLQSASNLGKDNTSIITVSQDIGPALNEQIDLFALDNGEYIIHEANNYSAYNAFHYSGENMYSETIYSFPNNEGRRKKITIKGKDSSPALLISVSTQVELPASYYDVVVIKDSSVDTTSWIDPTLKVKEVTNIVDAYKVNSSYAINVIDGTNVYASNYVKCDDLVLKPTKIAGGIYDELDSDNAIRELGGYVFNAGYGMAGDQDYAIISRQIKNVQKSSHIGKYTISIGKEIENPNEVIRNIFAY